MSFNDPPPRSTGVGSLYTPTPCTASTGSYAVASGYGSFLGAHVSEQQGSTCGVRFWDGASQNLALAVSQLTSIIEVGPSSGQLFWLGPQGVAVASQVYLERVYGKSEVVVYGQ